MAFTSFNGNNNGDNRPTVNTYSSIAFSNPDSQIAQTRFNLSYFNKMMTISIAQRNPGNDQSYPTYNNDAAVRVFLSFTQAKMLHDMAVDMFEHPENGKTNVCLETKNGLFKISNGSEYGSETPCVSITYMASDGSSTEVVYQTKANYDCAYNFVEGQYSKQAFPRMEMDAILMTFEQYWLASSYAVASTMNEANMYRERSKNELLRSIADKLGVVSNTNKGNYSGGYGNHTFLSNAGANTTQAGTLGGAPMTNEVPKQYSSQSFDDMVASISSANPGAMDDD